MNLKSSGQTLNWIHKTTASTSVNGQGAYSQSSAIDLQGNIYQIGYFNGPTDFDPGAGFASFTPAGDADIFITKSDSTGKFIWAKSIGGIGVDVPLSIISDADNSIYVTGYYAATVDFDPGSGVYNLSTINSGMFILKLDNNGVFKWVAGIQGTGYNYGMSITVDVNNNVYATGIAGPNTDFDPGPGVVHVNFGGVLGQNAFLLKLNSSGLFQWVKPIEGSLSSGQNVYYDGRQGVFMSGAFSGVADMDPSTGVNNISSTGNNDGFLLKFDTTGTVLWVKIITGPGEQNITKVIGDSRGNLNCTGFFTAQTDFDPGISTSTLTSINSSEDVFVLQLDSLGNYRWVKSFGDSTMNIGKWISLNESDDLFISGEGFSGTIDFDPGPGLYNLSASGLETGYLLTLDSAGNFKFAEVIKSSAFSRVNFTHSKGNCTVLSGYFKGTADFDPQIGVFEIESSINGSSPDAFLMKTCRSSPCIGFNPLPDTLFGCVRPYLLNAGSGYSNYFWNTGEVSSTISVQNEGLYLVYVLGSDGCASQDSCFVIFGDAEIQQSDTTLCKPVQITLSVDSSKHILKSSYGIGDLGPAKGKVFYDQGNIIDGWRYLEASPDFLTQKHFWINAIPVYAGANSLWDGMRNTANILNFNSFVNSAAKGAADYAANGFYDWYLPAREELKVLLQNATIVGGLNCCDDIWSSTEADGNNSWGYNWNNSSPISYDNKINYKLIRPIRRFAPALYSTKVLWSTGDTTFSIPVFPSVTTTFYVTITKGSYSCTDSIKIIVNNIDTGIVLLDSPDLCSTTGSIRLQAGHATSWQWLRNGVPIPGAINRIYTATSAGNYSAVLTNGTCTDTSIIQFVNPKKSPKADFYINRDTQCLNNNFFQFDDASISSQNIVLWKWYFGDGSNSSLRNSLHHYTSSGSYNVKLYISTIEGCADSLSKMVSVNSNPVAQIITPTDTIICQGSTVTLFATGGDTYQWFLNGNLLPGATNSNFQASLPGSYSVKAFSLRGCDSFSVNTINLSLNEKPIVDYSIQNTCVSLPVIFSNQSDVSKSGPVIYEWSFGDGIFSNNRDATHIYDKVGTYIVKLVVRSAHCTTLVDSITKSITIIAGLEGIKYKDVYALKNTSVLLSARNIGTSYKWQPNSGLNSSTTRTPIFNFDQEQKYLIRISSESGCVTIDTQVVKIFTKREIYVPKGFTPNNDGQNDRMFPILIGLDKLNYFRVYNRWGVLVFEMTSMSNQGWDGKFRDVLQPSESYAWVAEAFDDQGQALKRTGNFILIR